MWFFSVNLVTQKQFLSKFLYAPHNINICICSGPDLNGHIPICAIHILTKNKQIQKPYSFPFSFFLVVLTKCNKYLSLHCHFMKKLYSTDMILLPWCTCLVFMVSYHIVLLFWYLGTHQQKVGWHLKQFKRMSCLIFQADELSARIFSLLGLYPKKAEKISLWQSLKILGKEEIRHKNKVLLETINKGSREI